MEVIGKAIGDCVTMQNEFADKRAEEIITFERTDPTQYERKHWNAVFLYNYIHAGLGPLYDNTDAESIFRAIYDKVTEHYKSSYKLSIKMLRAMKDAKNDIILYDNQLELGKILKQCRQAAFLYKYAQNVNEKNA